MSSSRKLPFLTPPEYLDRVVQASSDIDLKVYSSELGLSNNLKRIAPNVDPPKRYNGAFLSANIPAPFIDPPIVRSEAWSSFDFTKSSKKRRWIRFKTNFMSCIKSVKCRFTALGFLLGCLISLGALIPILVIWLTSGSNSSTTTLTPSNTLMAGLTGFQFVVSTAVPTCSAYYCQEVVIFNSNWTITALSLIVTVQSTAGVTYNGEFTSHSSISSAYNTSSTQIVYVFTVSNNQIPAGNYTCGVGINLPGVNHTTSTDTYTITATNLCGSISTASGTF